MVLDMKVAIRRQMTIHPEVMDDLTEVLSKASICLGNMACNLQQCWKKHEKDV